MSLKTYHGSCHCGDVKYEADLDLSLGTGKCNCSYCKKVRNWSTIIKPAAFRLLSGEGSLSFHQFGTKSNAHYFCKNCGIRVYSKGHVKEIGGDYISISIASLDDAEPSELIEAPVRFFDGLNNNWMNEPSEIRHL
ncbi:aldehyde-activating protein [Leptospira kobayashii]|uniref:Aldehyde-activating protein n=1 Tax=Leptospira kobayashii TaxID=1917830 RepID=A0ABN6KD06_9LEPT|nr:GFA family protein [Leptospira kobayashii]BDA77700.1 aldehyde-activating protein [Leptospira kobayashii]